MVELGGAQADGRPGGLTGERRRAYTRAAEIGVAALLAKFSRWERIVVLVSLCVAIVAALVLALRREETRSVAITLVPVSTRSTQPGVIDLNRAGPDELATVPGIGPVLASRIVKWREERGGFRSLEELLKVPGIGARLLNQIRGKVRVGP